MDIFGLKPNIQILYKAKLTDVEKQELKKIIMFIKPNITRKYKKQYENIEMRFNTLLKEGLSIDVPNAAAKPSDVKEEPNKKSIAPEFMAIKEEILSNSRRFSTDAKL